VALILTLSRGHPLGGTGKYIQKWWHWKIYPKMEAGPKVVGNMKFQTREAAIAACIVEINSGLDRGQRGGGSE
jgi:hypothetical protein